MEDHINISKGNLHQAKISTIIQTYNIMAADVNNNPKMTCNADLYCRDVMFLLQWAEQLSMYIKDNCATNKPAS